MKKRIIIGVLGVMLCAVGEIGLFNRLSEDDWLGYLFMVLFGVGVLVVTLTLVEAVESQRKEDEKNINGECNG